MHLAKKILFSLALPFLAAALPAQYLTHYWVDAAKGSDTNPGTSPAKPFKSITKAIGLAQLNAVVHVMPGVYSPTTTKEKWAWQIGTGASTPYKNVKILGAGPSKCVIDFGNVAPTGSYYIMVWHFASQIEIAGFTFKNSSRGKWYYFAINMEHCKKVNVHDCVFVDQTGAMAIWGGAQDVSVHHNVFLKGPYPALRLRLNDTSSPKPKNDYIYNNLFYAVGHNAVELTNKSGAQHLYNNIALNCSGYGFLGGPAKLPIVFENNLAFGNTKGNYNVPFKLSKTNLSVDPMLVDPAKGDYHLKPGSPCIDAGHVGALPFMGADFYGDCPLTDSDENGIAAAEIGVHEVNFNHLSVTNWGMGKTAVFSNTPYNASKSYPGFFFLGFRIFNASHPQVGFFGVDPTSILILGTLPAPGKFQLTLPRNPLLKGLPVYVQALNFGPRQGGGYAFKPTARLTLYLF